MLPFQHHAALDQLNTFGFSVTAEQFVTITKPEQLPELCAYCDDNGLPLLLLGGGSNLVLADFIPGVVAQIALKGWQICEQQAGRVRLRVAAGECWHDVVTRAVEEGVYGLENLALIPGTAGAAPMQNIGAYGVELKDHLLEVEVYDRVERSFSRLDREACRFGYRDSLFKSIEPDRYIIVAIWLELSREFHPVLSYGALAELRTRLDLTARDLFLQVCEIRRSKLPDPQLQGNVGSFFKNPVISAVLHARLKQQFPGLVSYPDPEGFKLAAGWLIDQCGWKGRQAAGIGVYPHQALVLINLGAGDRAQVEALAAAIQDSVRQRFGVWLEPEPRFYPA